MFILRILIFSCIIVLYVVVNNIFVVIAYKHSVQEILKCHIKDCFKINGKQRIIMPQKVEYVKLRNYERKIKSPFIIYADCERILMPEDNKKQNPKEFHTTSYGFKLVCADDKFSKAF